MFLLGPLLLQRRAPRDAHHQQLVVVLVATHALAARLEVVGEGADAAGEERGLREPARRERGVVFLDGGGDDDEWGAVKIFQSV